MREEIDESRVWEQDEDDGGVFHPSFGGIAGYVPEHFRHKKKKIVKMCIVCGEQPARNKYCRDCSYEMSLETQHRAYEKKAKLKREHHGQNTKSY